MSATAGNRPGPAGPSFSELFTPKLVTVLREGYGRRHLQADVMAGLTVAIVALPLSMAIAIASGATPAQGLYTAIIGGFLVSLLGGSRFQIGGPAGAFIVLVATTLHAHGIDGLILATMPGTNGYRIEPRQANLGSGIRHDRHNHSTPAAHSPRLCRSKQRSSRPARAGAGGGWI